MRYVCAQMLSCVQLGDPMDCSLSVSSMEFSRQEYWGGLPFPPPGDLPDPGIEPQSLEIGLIILFLLMMSISGVR